jgi:hypothetical protein
LTRDLEPQGLGDPQFIAGGSILFRELEVISPGRYVLTPNSEAHTTMGVSITCLAIRMAPHRPRRWIENRVAYLSL